MADDERLDEDCAALEAHVRKTTQAGALWPQGFEAALAKARKKACEVFKATLAATGSRGKAEEAYAKTYTKVLKDENERGAPRG